MLRSPFCGPLCQAAGPAETANASAPHRHIWLNDGLIFPILIRDLQTLAVSRGNVSFMSVLCIKSCGFKSWATTPSWDDVPGHWVCESGCHGRLVYEQPATRSSSVPWTFPNPHPNKTGNAAQLTPNTFSIIQFDIILDVQQNVQQQFLPGKMPRWNVANRREY